MHALVRLGMQIHCPYLCCKRDCPKMDYKFFAAKLLALFHGF